MNVFILDLDVTKCAQFHCDKHVVKMILETAQIMSTALTSMGVKHNGYRSTHPNHPCCVWARNLSHLLYLRSLGRALGIEYHVRYGKRHKSLEVIEGLPIPEMTVAVPHQWALAMPTEYHQYSIQQLRDSQGRMTKQRELTLDVVKSYRAYYRSKKGKFDMKWTNRNVPSWFN